jgi:hypothetical protein
MYGRADRRSQQEYNGITGRDSSTWLARTRWRKQKIKNSENIGLKTAREDDPRNIQPQDEVKTNTVPQYFTEHCFVLKNQDNSMLDTNWSE